MVAHYDPRAAAISAMLASWSSAERVDRSVEDARDAAFGVRATPRPSSSAV
jgi:hypothetical protein